MNQQTEIQATHPFVNQDGHHMKWRLVRVSHSVPAATFLTIQREDFKCLPYSKEAQVWFKEIEATQSKLKVSSIGDGYYEWNEGEIPEYSGINDLLTTQPSTK